MSEHEGKAIRVFLIDDHPAVRQGLALLLSQNAHEVCGEAGNRTEVMDGLDTMQADVVLLDLSLGNESGLDLIPTLRAKGFPVLVYSMHEDCETIQKAFNMGADGYVSKREVSDVIFEAIDDLLARRRFISPRTARSLASKVLLADASRDLADLSPRENEILDRLGRGESNGEISERLCIGVRTVETYCARIIQKLRLDGMADLRKFAIKRNQTS